MTHVWYVDAGIEDTPERVYTHFVLATAHRRGNTTLRSTLTAAGVITANGNLTYRMLYLTQRASTEACVNIAMPASI